MLEWIVVLAAIVVAVVVLYGVFTGRLKRARIGRDGVELEASDSPGQRNSPLHLVPRDDPEETSPPEPSPQVSAWRSYVDADHDVYFGADEQDFEDIQRLVSRGPCGRLTSLHGAGGLGKTAAAREAVEACRDSYSMIGWASFRQYQDPHSVDRRQGVGRSTREVLRDLSQQLGLSINNSDSTIEDQFYRAIKRTSEGERVLIVIDNLERAVDLRDSLRYVATKKDLVKHCHVVITTRASAGRLSRVVDERPIKPLSLGISCELVRHQGRGAPGLDQADDEELKPIFDVADGNPYLLRLVARRLRHQASPLSVILREVSNLQIQGRRSGSAEQIRDYLYANSLKELSDQVGLDEARALVHAFGAEPAGSRIPYDVLQDLSGLPDASFSRTLDTAYELALVTKHGLNKTFSIHGLLHGYTTGKAAEL